MSPDELSARFAALEDKVESRHDALEDKVDAMRIDISDMIDAWKTAKGISSFIKWASGIVIGLGVFWNVFLHGGPK